MHLIDCGINLAVAGIEYGADGVGGVNIRSAHGEGFEGAYADHFCVGGIGEGFGDAEADAQAGERSRADGYAYDGDVGHGGLGMCEQPFYAGHKALAVELAGGEADCAYETATGRGGAVVGGEYGCAAGVGGGFQAEDEVFGLRCFCHQRVFTRRRFHGCWRVWLWRGVRGLPTNLLRLCG